MKIKQILSIAIFSTVALSAFAAKAEPEWLSEPAKVYPAAKYLSAVGSGSSKDNAKIEAVKELTLYLQTSVSTNTSTTLSDNGKTAQANLIEETKISSGATFGELKYSDFYKKGKDWYVCVYLERSKAWQQIDSNLSGILTKFHSFYDKSLDSHPLRANYYLNLSKEPAQEFLATLSIAKIVASVNANEKYSKEEAIMNTLDSVIAENLAKTTLYINAPSDTSSLLTNFLNKELKAAGFTLARTKAQGLYQVQAEIEYNEEKSGSGEDTTYKSVPSVEITLEYEDDTVFSYSCDGEKNISLTSMDKAKEGGLKKLVKKMTDFKDQLNAELSK